MIQSLLHRIYGWRLLCSKPFIVGSHGLPLPVKYLRVDDHVLLQVHLRNLDDQHPTRVTLGIPAMGYGHRVFELAPEERLPSPVKIVVEAWRDPVPTMPALLEVSLTQSAHIEIWVLP